MKPDLPTRVATLFVALTLTGILLLGLAGVVAANVWAWSTIWGWVQ